MSSIYSYHAHIYFGPDQLADAEELVERVRSNFDLEIGRIWNKPIGPHPTGSCQITVPKEEFGKVIPWLMEERGDLDVFVHANTGNDLADHTQFVGWLGKSYELNIEMFKD